MKIQTDNPVNDVVEMVQHIVPEDPAFADELEDQINRRKIVNQLRGRETSKASRRRMSPRN